jgi:hydrogenase maturation protease
MPRTLVLGLGNELLSDDAVGILAVRRLREELNDQVDVIESSLSGVALMELFVGYDRAIIVDAVQTGEFPPGSIREFTPADLDRVLAPSPHYAGIPEILALARQLELDFPREIRILAIEVGDSTTIGGALSPAVAMALPKLIGQVKSQVARWQGEALHA